MNGNRTRYEMPGPGGWVETASFDAQDRILQQGQASFQFNADGQLAQIGASTYQYSTQGELLQATVGGQTVTYTYDGMGRRVAKTDSTGTYQYLYGNLNKPFQLTAMRDPAGVLSTFYYDDAGLLFAMDKNGSRFYIATDQGGTPKAVSDNTGTVVKVMTFDSFGFPTLDSNSNFKLPVGFAGGLTDTNTGLVRFGYRDYEPASGRWTAKDPIFFKGGQGNLYSYVQNNPVRFIDPSGLWYIDLNITLGAGGGGTLGFQIGPNGANLYGGIGIGLGAAASATVHTSSLPCSGLSVATTESIGAGLGANASQSYDSTGFTKTGDTYGDMGAGVGIGAGASLTGTYTLRLW